jgi:hypothetical protein
MASPPPGDPLGHREQSSFRVQQVEGARRRAAVTMQALFGRKLPPPARISGALLTWFDAVDRKRPPRPPRFRNASACARVGWTRGGSRPGPATTDSATPAGHGALSHPHVHLGDRLVVLVRDLGVASVIPVRVPTRHLVRLQDPRRSSRDLVGEDEALLERSWIAVVLA